MKSLKLLFTVLLTNSLFTSCIVKNEIIDPPVSLNELVTSYDLWYIDVHNSSGVNISFLEKAFTISFRGRIMYANNNIVDIGKIGNGLGIDIGNYYVVNDILEINHNLDGTHDFRINQLSADKINLIDLTSNASYSLIGYQKNKFDYDKLFYDNIEYFLQEYDAWVQVESKGGTSNSFDEERFLRFTSEDNTSFYSSNDLFGTNIDVLNWNYAGGYTVRNVEGTNDLKYLTLNYDNGDNEEFDLTIIGDGTIELLHVNSSTTYVFSGRGFIQYLKRENEKSAKVVVRNNNRKRTKIKRETVIKRI